MSNKLQIHTIGKKNQTSAIVVEIEGNKRLQPQAQAGIAIMPLGGSGIEDGMKACAIRALSTGGAIPPTFTMDNATPEQRPISLPNNLDLSFPPPHGKHLHLNTYDNGQNRRDAIRSYPQLKALFEEQGLFRGYSVVKTGWKGGAGGAGYPLMSYADLLLKIADVRIHIRAALQAAAGEESQPQGSVFAPVVNRRTRRNNTVYVFVYAGGSGSFGAGASPTLGYIIRDEARNLGLIVEVWLILTGPLAYTGYTNRTLASYGATISTLQHLADHGYTMDYIDGTSIHSAAPPYTRIMLVDERLPLTKEGKVEQGAHDLFGWQVGGIGAALMQPEVRASYLNAIVGMDDASIFSTVQMSMGGFLPELLVGQLKAEFAREQASALNRLLASVA